ncbi:MAG TPA: response regulator [Planctomycetota bacterium]|jgi:response regulator RpfG family c-di-GMP phosphodiesterase|nr:response regulator [Planctomycetota bacterium]
MNEIADREVVVCIDDEPEILSSLRRLLRNEPYEVLTTEKPDEAVTWVLEKKARVLIADQRMPSMTGLQLLEIVRACSPETARVMLTGQSDLTGVMKVRSLEAISRLVRKPWEPEELKGLVRELLRQKPPVVAGPSR